MKDAPRDHLTLLSLLRLLAVMALVLAPHLPRLPPWEMIFVPALLAWRTLAALRQWRLPNTWLRVILTLGAFAGVMYSYQRINGQHAGTALLVVMATLKLLEMRSRRDVRLTVSLMYFILITHFLFSQEIWTIGYLLACTVAITALLIDINHTGQALPLKLVLRAGAVMVGWALPLMLLLFILFPRIPGPLWGLPSDAGAERSGLADEMTPGDISKLVQSDAVSFRVQFDGAPPPPRERYWRGPVFEQFNGRGWKPSPTPHRDVAPPAQLLGTPVRYEIILEPQRQVWLFALDLPANENLPPEAFINARYQLVMQKSVRERLLYNLVSYPSYRLQPELSSDERSDALQNPPRFNPKTRELAQRWRALGLSDEQIVSRALQMFHQENFYYTLEPPITGRDSIDEFLFETRRGFCEHYASAFTVLMRAAGIPARVVTGYQGGENNQFGDYTIVRQSDAHAWAEVWLAGRGWSRVDPTSVIAPSRIERGIPNTLGAAGELSGYFDRSGRLLGTLQAQWDWANATWNRTVLAYGPELQGEFLERFGLHDWSDMILALTVLLTAVMSVVGLVLLRQFRPASNEDAALKLWRRALRKLNKRGMHQRPDEGPRDFTERLGRQLPQFGAPMKRVLDAYLKLRYLDEPAPHLERELRAAFKAL